MEPVGTAGPKDAPGTTFVPGGAGTPPAEKPAPRDQDSAPVDPDQATSFSPRPLPTKDVRFRLPDGRRLTLRLRGLTWLERQEIIALRNFREAEAARDGAPDMFNAQFVARCLCKPDSSPAYPAQHQWLAKGEALARQWFPAELERAVGIGAQLSGFGADAEDEAGKD